MKETGVEVEGVVIESVKNMFVVKIFSEKGEEETTVKAHLAGKLRKNNIRIVPGDKVRVELSPYDLTRGRIVFRMKN